MAIDLLVRLRQIVDTHLRILREVERRQWFEILLASVNPIDEVGEAGKLIRIAKSYRQFKQEYPSLSLDAKHEAYAVLRAAYDYRTFPPRRSLSKAQFSRLLALHLERL